jgi:tetratricopeptide (TPR) repeat protein
MGRRLYAEARRDLKAALDAAEAGRVSGVQRAEILNRLGRVETQLGRLRPAIFYYERALGLLAPADRAPDLFNIAPVYRELGEAREAERYAREALTVASEDARILRLLGSVLIQQGRYREAEGVAQRALGTGDAAITAMVWTDFAIIEEARRRYGAAAELLQRAVDGMEAEHARARVLSNLSVQEQRLRRYQEAVVHARQAVGEMEAHAGPQHPDMCKALERYAEALRHSGRSDEARMAAQKARQLQSLLGATVDWRSSKW